MTKPEAETIVAKYDKATINTEYGEKITAKVVRTLGFGDDTNDYDVEFSFEPVDCRY